MTAIFDQPAARAIFAAADAALDAVYQSRWGHWQAATTDGLVRIVVVDDGTVYVYRLTGPGQLVADQATLSGTSATQTAAVIVRAWLA